MSLLQRLTEEVHQGLTQLVPQRQVCIELYGCSPNRAIALAEELAVLHSAQSRVLMNDQGIAVVLSSAAGLLVSDVQHDLAALLA